MIFIKAYYKYKRTQKKIWLDLRHESRRKKVTNSAKWRERMSGSIGRPCSHASLGPLDSARWLVEPPIFVASIATRYVT